MPLVDDENQLHDSKLSNQFNKHFSGGNSGNIVDIYGNSWYVSQENDFSKFLSLLESNMGIPLGRVFHNSAADSFEIILDSLNSVNFGLFPKRNRQRYILTMWEIFGWGSFDIKNNTIHSHVNSTIITGFYLATVEFQNQSRYKIQWRQLTDTLIACELEQLDRALSMPVSLPDMPWANGIMQTIEANELLIERKEIGWSIDGKQSCVLPCDLINRIIFNAGGYVDNVNKSLDNYWLLDGISQKITSSTKALLQTCKELFLATDVYVFLNETNNWNAIIQTHLEPFGLGLVRHESSTRTTDEFVVELTPNAILAIGKITGLWERASGKQSVCSVELTNTDFRVSIESRLEYN